MIGSGPAQRRPEVTVSTTNTIRKTPYEACQQTRAQHRVIMRTGGADGIDQADAAVGQSPCRVGNQYVDVAEILDADQPFDRNLEPRDPLLLLVPRVGNRIWSTKPAAALGFATVDAKDVRMADNAMKRSVVGRAALVLHRRHIWRRK